METDPDLSEVLKLTDLQEQVDSKQPTPAISSQVSPRAATSGAQKNPFFDAIKESFKRGVKSKISKQRQTALRNEYRYKFQVGLQKLGQQDTREVGLSELKRYIQQYTGKDFLKVWLSCLSEPKYDRSPKTKEAELITINYIVICYGPRLADHATLGKLGSLVHAYFGERNRAVHKAAGHTLTSIYLEVLAGKPTDDIIAYMFEPLQALLLSDVELHIRQGAAAAILVWLQQLATDKAVTIIEKLVTPVLEMFLTTTPDFADLVSCIGVIIDSTGFASLIPEIYQLLRQLQAYVEKRSQYLLQVEACNVLKLVGEELKKVGSFDQYTREVVKTLKQTRMDKVPVVQAAAKEALVVWDEPTKEELDSLRVGETPERAGQQTSRYTALLTARSLDRPFGPNSIKPTFLTKYSGSYAKLRTSSNQLSGRRTIRRSYYTDRLRESMESEGSADQVFAPTVIARDGPIENPPEANKIVPRTEEIEEVPEPVIVPDDPPKVEELPPPPPAPEMMHRGMNCEPRFTLSTVSFTIADISPGPLTTERGTDYLPPEEDPMINDAMLHQIGSWVRQLENQMDNGVDQVEGHLSNMSSRLSFAQKRVRTLEKQYSPTRVSLPTSTRNLFPTKRRTLRKTESTSTMAETQMTSRSSLLPVRMTDDWCQTDGPEIDVSETQTPLWAEVAEAEVQTDQIDEPILVDLADAECQTCQEPGPQNIDVSSSSGLLSIDAAVETHQEVETQTVAMDDQVVRSQEVQTARPEFASVEAQTMETYQPPSVEEIELQAGTSAVDRSVQYEDAPPSPDLSNVEEIGPEHQTLCTTWSRSVDLAKEGKYREAYAAILETDDDLFILRLMHVSGPCLFEIGTAMATTLLERVGKMVISPFIPRLMLAWTAAAAAVGTLSDLTVAQSTTVSQALFKISEFDGEDGVQAAQLYQMITA